MAGSCSGTESGATQPILVSAVAAGAGLRLCTAIFGRQFLEDLFARREYAWAHVIGHIGRLQWSALALVIWGSWAWSAGTCRAARFTVLHVAFGFGACILRWLGHGVGRNADFDLIIGLGIGIGVAFERIETSLLAIRIGVDRTRDLLLVILVLRVGSTGVGAGASRAYFPAGQQAVLYEAARVAGFPGDVFCSNKVVAARQENRLWWTNSRWRNWSRPGRQPRLT